MTNFSYTTQQIPPNYQCSKCGTSGCKLWRQFQTFLENIRLLCVDCALEDQGKNYEISEDGSYIGQLGSTDGIGWLIPAVPTEENDIFWEYTLVPETGVLWWERLPLRI